MGTEYTLGKMGDAMMVFGLTENNMEKANTRHHQGKFQGQDCGMKVKGRNGLIVKILGILVKIRRRQKNLKKRKH